MSILPRLAVGSVQAGFNRQPVLWGMVNVLERCARHAQVFLSQSRFVSSDGSRPLAGQRHRHLDSWIMSRESAVELFLHGAQACDLSIVEGSYDMAREMAGGGSLDTLCDWLDLPRLVVLDVSQLDACRFPARPPAVDGLILDRVPDASQVCRLKTTMETLWGVPVFGALDELPQLRTLVASLPRGTGPSRELCEALGDAIAAYLDLPGLLQLADRPPMRQLTGTKLFGPQTDEPLNVAIAYDEAFFCYFPDTLDMLESRGATINDFSPLRSESLPPETDLVYIGCGHPERFARRLAGNCCLKEALRKHAASGKRIYGECAGLAYLCAEMVLEQDNRFPMACLLPATAHHLMPPARVEPAEITLRHDCWLGRANSLVRGYLNSSWSIQPTEPLALYPKQLRHRSDLVGCGPVLGSRLHINFAAQPDYLNHFFRPSHSSIPSSVF